MAVTMLWIARTDEIITPTLIIPATQYSEDHSRAMFGLAHCVVAATLIASTYTIATYSAE